MVGFREIYKLELQPLRMRNNKIIIISICLAVFLILMAGYFVFNNDNLGKRTNIVGEGVCGSYPYQYDRDICCTSLHSRDEPKDCFGGWKYFEENESCSYVCGDEVDLIEECILLGGTWREFSNGCVDSCSYERNEEVFCSQAITEGCDCGIDMCWNGKECVSN